MLHLPIWSIYLLAYHYQNSDSYASFELFQLPTSFSLVVLLGITLLGAAAYYINQIADYETDLVNDKLGFLQKNMLSRREMASAFVLCASGAVFIGLVLSSPVIQAVYLFLLLLSIVYSVSPCRLKDRPISGWVANSFSYGFLIPASMYHEPAAWMTGRIDWLLLTYFISAVAAIHVMTTIPDREGDSATGKRTIGVILSPRVAVVVALTLVMWSGGVALWSAYYLLAAISLVCIVPLIVAYFTLSGKLILLSAKLPILLLTILAGYYFPMYLLFIVVLLIVCRIYYRKRFNMRYPRLN